jgi:hypothetical protein
VRWPPRCFYRRRRPDSVECKKMRSDRSYRSDRAGSTRASPAPLPRCMASWPIEPPWPRSSEDSSSDPLASPASEHLGRPAQRRPTAFGRPSGAWPAVSSSAGAAQRPPSGLASGSYSASHRARGCAVGGPSRSPSFFFLFFCFFLFAVCLDGLQN